MAGYDDDSFGDFTFASSTQFTPPSKSNTLVLEDDEWGDFVEYPTGSEPSSASSFNHSKPLDPFGFESTSRSNGWVKPSGALPLSLFGEQEEDQKEKHKPNGSNANLSHGFDSFYNQDHKFKSENGSFSNSNKLDSVKPNAKGANSASPCVSRVQSLNYLASLNDEAQHKSAGLFMDSNNVSSSANVSSSIFTRSNPDFEMSKSIQNGLNRTLSVDAATSLNDQGLLFKTKSTGLDFESNASSSSANFASSSFGVWNPGFDMSNSNQNGLSSELSVDAATSLNDQEGLQIKANSTGIAFGSNASSSSENSTSSSFGMWNPDFHISKSNQNGLSRTSSPDVPSNLNGQGQNVGIDLDLIGLSSTSTAATSSVWNADINSFNSNQTGLNRTLSLDALTNLNDQGQQIKTESGGLVPISNGSSSFVNASSSTLSGWNFDFGGLGSANERSNSIVSSNVSGLNSNFNVVGASENLNATQSNNDDEDEGDDDDDGWEFKDAYSTSTVGDGSNKAASEAKEGNETNAFSFDFHNGLNGSVDLFANSNGSTSADSKAHHANDTQAYSSGFSNNGSIDLFAKSNEPIDLFAACNGISSVHSDNMLGSDIEPSMASKSIYFSASDSRGEQNNGNGVPDPHPVVRHAEPDEDFGEFTAAFSDSELKLEEEWKVNDVAHYELQASETDDKDQGKESKLENKGALPLSLFGDEELEIDGSSNIEDIFVPQNASYSKNDRSSNISINDLISNLYSQAEHISPVQVPTSISDSKPDLGSNSNLVNYEEDLDDGDWEFKDGSSEMRTDNYTSPLTSEDPVQRSFASLNQDDYLDLYSKLRSELCYRAKFHLDNLKNSQSTDGVQVEEAKITTLIEEVEEACKDIEMDNALCKGGHLEGPISQNACMSAFIETLQEPRFQVLESEYHLSRRLSLVENDLETTMDLIKHATVMLKILKSGSLEEQSIYVSVWYKMISVCAQELQHGSCIWKKILEMNAQSHMLSHPKGREFIRALGEIYRVIVVLEASVKLCKPWTWLNSAQCTNIHSMLDECHTLWSSAGLGEALSSMLDSASSEDGSSVASLLDSVKFIHGLDVLAVQKHLFAQKEVCRLSLLTLEVLPGMNLIDWNGEHFCLTLANLWANLITSDPPELPHLIF